MDSRHVSLHTPIASDSRVFRQVPSVIRVYPSLPSFHWKPRNRPKPGDCGYVSQLIPHYLNRLLYPADGVYLPSSRIPARQVTRIHHKAERNNQIRQYHLPKNEPDLFRTASCNAIQHKYVRPSHEALLPESSLYHEWRYVFHSHRIRVIYPVYSYQK